MLALVGAVLLTSCAKNSGFQDSPAALARLKAQEPEASPAETQSPAVGTTVKTQSAVVPDSAYMSKVKIKSTPTPPPEFMPPQGPITLNDSREAGVKSFERYQAVEQQRQDNPTPKEVLESYPLSWESTRRPERKNWSTYTYQVIEKNFESFDQVQDAEIFCKHYELLEKKYKVIFWAMLISQITFHESSWNPTARALEGSMGVDGVTKLPVYSEGLMQLSYQDAQWSPYCKFDWSKDRQLVAKDPRRTILNPYLNLSCGIKVLADQIARHGKIVMKKNIYWAVLHEDGKYSKAPEMAAAIQKRLPFCR